MQNPLQSEERFPVTRSTLPSKKVLRAAAPLAFWLVVWQLAAQFAGNSLLIPSPQRVLTTLAELMATAAFWQTIGWSLARISLGLLIGAVLGVAIAALTCFVKAADLLLSPAIRVVRATPVASFIILVLLWVSASGTPTVITALMVLPVVWGNTRQGCLQTDLQLLEMARAYGFGRWKTLRLIYVPSALPYFTSGVTTALGLAWKAGVAAEVLCQPKHSIGAQVYYAKLYLETPSLFAWTLAVVLLSMALEKLLKLALRRLGRDKT